MRVLMSSATVESFKEEHLDNFRFTYFGLRARALQKERENATLRGNTLVVSSRFFSSPSFPLAGDTNWFKGKSRLDRLTIPLFLTKLKSKVTLRLRWRK